MAKQTHQKGFTLVELLIATAVFSLVLMVFLSAFLRISQLFYKGVNMSNTQEATRAVLQDISNDVIYYNNPPDTTNIASGVFCVGNHRYVFYRGVQVGSSSNSGIYRDSVSSTNCPLLSVQPLGANAEQLLDPGMQVNKLSVSPNNGVVNIDVMVVFYGGDKSVLVSPSGQPNPWTATDAHCSGNASSSQYCATSEYTSTVLQSF